MTDAERKIIKDDLEQLHDFVRDISFQISDLIAMVGMSEPNDETLTKVYCTFDECLHYRPYSESYGICANDCIVLDEEVSGRTCGCPDAEWEEPQKSCSTCGCSPQTSTCETCEGYSNWWTF